MNQLLWSAASVAARVFKNRRAGFFDTDILRKDHKGEAALQPAALRIAVAVEMRPSTYRPLIESNAGKTSG